MKITLHVLSTCVPNDPEPCWPHVFVTAAEADKAFEDNMQREWEAAGIEDDETGEKLPFPNDANEAHDQLKAHWLEHGTELWGQWEITPHTIEVPVPALDVLRQLRAVNPEFETGAIVDHADVTRRLAGLWPAICAATDGHKIEAPILGKLVTMLDAIHQIMDTQKEARQLIPYFDEIGCLIAEANGEYKPEENANG